MAANIKKKRRGIDVVGNQMEIKVEPTLECYVKEEHENISTNFEDNDAIPSTAKEGNDQVPSTAEECNETIPSTAEVGASILWTSKATACLINQYKKYRSMVGQSTQIKSLREMFEMISLELQNYGFYFSPQKCENKWRVLERKYKNLIYRERLKKPGRIRHYGHWEHKRALDEIFNEKIRHAYLEENDFLPPTDPTSTCSNNNIQNGDPLASLTYDVMPDKQKEESNCKNSLSTLFERFMHEMRQNFALAERNKERRHRAEMAIRLDELEVKKRLLNLKERKMELAAAQRLRLNMQ